MILDNSILKRDDTAKERDQLKLFMDKFKAVNSKLLTENEDLKHKYEVAEKLRLDIKENLTRYITGAVMMDRNL